MTCSIMQSTAHNNRKQFGAARPDAHCVRAAVAGRYCARGVPAAGVHRVAGSVARSYN